MDDEIEKVVIGIRADTSAFARDVAAMRGELEGPLAVGAQRAGRMIEGSLVRAVSTGKFGFDDLRRVALSAMSEIASASVRSLFAQVAGGGNSGLLGSLAALTGGLPGRATGGSVSADRPYWVGERGPELFVPSGAGRIEPVKSGDRQVRIAINVNGGAKADAPQALRQSSRQIARAVRSALIKGQP